MQSPTTHPLGGQTDVMMPTKPAPDQEKEAQDKVVKLWGDRFTKAKAFLDPYFERDQQAFEFWYMWREFRGPYRANIFPPDVHAGIEAVVPRLTKGRPRPIVKPRPGQSPELLLRIQRGHDAYWDRMGMDGKFETVTKRGSWFGFGIEKVTPKVEGHEEPATQTVEVMDQVTGQPTGTYAEQPVMNDDGSQKTKFVVDYAGPEVEVLDPQRVYFPRGYASDAELPWVLFQYFKKRSELDSSLYQQEVIDKLDGAPNLADDPTLNRDQVHRLPRKSQVAGQQNSDNIGTATNDIKTDDDKEDPTVELWEIWVRGTKKRPQGQLVTIANRKTILRDVDSTMPDGELPCNAFRYIEDTFNYRGIGIARQLERLVLERADKRNQRMDNVSRAIDGMTYVQENEPAEDSDFQHQPNGIIRLRDMSGVQERKVPDITQNAYQEDNIILQDEAKATGGNELVLSGGPRSAKTLGEADKIASSSNERYDGVIRRLERFLNRHAFLVTLIVQQTVEDSQHMDWTDPSGEAQAMEIDPQDWKAVKPEQIVYDAKSVIAYKEVSRQQGMQLMELVDKLLAGDPDKFLALKPILTPLLELFDEIKVSGTDLIKGIEAFYEAKKTISVPPPAPSPDKVLAAIADILRVNPTLVTFDQVQQALAMNGIKAAPESPEMSPGAPVSSPTAPITPDQPADVVPLDSPTPDPSQIIAAASRIPNQPHP